MLILWSLLCCFTNCLLLRIWRKYSLTNTIFRATFSLIYNQIIIAAPFLRKNINASILDPLLLNIILGGSKDSHLTTKYNQSCYRITNQFYGLAVLFSFFGRIASISRDQVFSRQFSYHFGYTKKSLNYS